MAVYVASLVTVSVLVFAWQVRNYHLWHKHRDTGGNSRACTSTSLDEQNAACLETALLNRHA